jgi:hypothetical protein
LGFGRYAKSIWGSHRFFCAGPLMDYQLVMKNFRLTQKNAVKMTCFEVFLKEKRERKKEEERTPPEC